MTTEYILAGFGGQGVLFAGKFLAAIGLKQDKQVSWLPSYGPEMRGGTANCSVIISDQVVGSPVVVNPEVVLALSLPALDKFESKIKPGGTVYIDSSLVARKVERKDVTAVYMPATQLASDNGVPKLANVIIMGKMLAAYDEKLIKAALVEAVGEKHKAMIEQNLKAFAIGKNY